MPQIVGLLAEFADLVKMAEILDSNEQHTFLENNNIRYVYQPIGTLYLLLVTNKQSNLLEDLNTLRLLSELIPEYSISLDEEGVNRDAFELIFAFDEAISMGHKENVTVAKVKKYCKVDGHEERLYKLVLNSKINECKDITERKANEIEKSKIEKNKFDKGGFMSSLSMDAGMIERFREMSISSDGGGFRSGSSFGLSTDLDSSLRKSKGRPTASSPATPKGLGMQLVKSQKTNQFLESLKAEGEVIIEDVQPSAGHRRTTSPLPTDDVIFTIEEKLNLTLKRNGHISSFDVQGTLFVKILKEEDMLVQVQVDFVNNSMIQFKIHPDAKGLCFNKNILELKEPKSSFLSMNVGDGVGLLTWRIRAVHDSEAPLQSGF